MKIKDFFFGKYSHKFFSNRLCLIMMIEFLGTLLFAYLLRPVWLGSEWVYIPFVDHISGLGQGRMEWNIGAWVFMIGFILFPIMGTAWNAYIFRRFSEVSKVGKIYGLLLFLVMEFSLINVSFVGIFDGVWPDQQLSGMMHMTGATYSFLGHVVSALLLVIGMTIIYIRTPSKDRKEIKHPLYFSLVLVELVGVFILFQTIGGAFWQWMIMLSLMFFLFAISRLFPEKNLKPNR